MTIVHLGPSALPVLYRLGGAIQRRIAELAKQQAARGQKVIVYSANCQSSRTHYQGVEIRSIACRRPLPLRDFEYLEKALRDLRNEQVDVLHFHSLAEGAAFSRRIPAKKFLSYDYYRFRRGKKTPLYWWYSRALRKFSCLLPVSDYCLRESRAYWALDSVPLRVVHNGVNLNQFYPDPAAGAAKKRALGLENQRVVLYVGRVCKQKGTDILSEAYARLKHQVPDVRLVVAGPAEQFGNAGESELTRQISETGGLYLGAVEEGALASVYNMADIFVMPTRELEMFGMAAVEAQACGKPVICSTHGGLREVISESSGLFFPVGNAAALAEKLRLLFEKPGLYRSLAAAAHTNAMRFDWTRIVDEIESVYREYQ